MVERVLFVSPARLSPIDHKGDPCMPPRQNVSLPALTILGSLKSEGFGVDFMDLSADGYKNHIQINQHVYRFGLPDEAVVERISEAKPDALLVTSMFSAEQKVVDDLIAKVRRAYPSLPIIAGGIHATLQPDWTLESGNVDFVVLGEGERTTPLLLRELESGNPELVSGIAYRGKDKIIETPQRPPISDLNRPWDLEGVLLRDGDYRYNDHASRRSSLYSHLTSQDWERSFSLYYSKGCPMHCDYCNTSEKDGFVIRHMGHRRMFRDFKELYEKFGVKIFYNQADTFGFHSEDWEFLRLVAEFRNQDPSFVINNPNAFFLSTFFSRREGSELNEDKLDLLAEAGFNVLTVAIETFNQRFNRKVNFDKLPPEKIRDLFTAIHEKGMRSELYMMYSFPGQTKEELHHDQRIIESFPDIDEITWHGFMAFPGTRYYRRGLEEGWFTEESYRGALEKGYFFHHYPDIFNFSQIPNQELREFRQQHLK